MAKSLSLLNFDSSTFAILSTLRAVGGRFSFSLGWFLVIIPSLVLGQLPLLVVPLLLHSGSV